MMKLVFNECTLQEGSCGGARLPSRNTGFDSVTGKKNSPVIKGHDGTTHRREWGGRDLLVTRMDEVAYRTLPPLPHTTQNN